MTDSDPVAGLEVYLVGGAVRDRLLGYPYHERDWVVVGATAEELSKRGFRQVGRDFPVFLHPDSGEEYALARTERKKGRGYLGFEVCATPEITLEEDLARRDLTINAIAMDERGQLIDPFHGASDISNRTLRHVGPAFVEDPLRIIRLARFYARYAHLGFRVAEQTLALCRRMADQGELDELAAERVWRESAKGLSERQPERFFELLANTGALAPWWRELAASERFSLALTRLVKVCEAGNESIAIRWAVLVSPLNDAARQALAERLKLPTEWRDAARGLADSLATLDRAFSGQTLVAWAGRMDYWRRPERWQQVAPALEVLLPQLDVQALAGWLEQAAAISPQPWIAQGLKGAEIGQRLAVERASVLEAAAQQLASTGD